MKPDKRKIKTAFIILSTLAAFLLIFLNNSLLDAVSFACAIAVHEFSHFIAAKAIGIPSVFEGASLMGFSIHADAEGFGAKAAVMYLAGAVGNLAFAAVIYILSFYITIPDFEYAVFCNLLFAAVNMIPAYPTDCARAVGAIMARRWGNVKSVRILSALSNFIALIFFVCGVYIFIFKSDNVLMMFAACLIFSCAKKENDSAKSAYLNEVAKGAKIRTFN